MKWTCKRYTSICKYITSIISLKDFILKDIYLCEKTRLHSTVLKPVRGVGSTVHVPVGKEVTVFAAKILKNFSFLAYSKLNKLLPWTCGVGRHCHRASLIICFSLFSSETTLETTNLVCSFLI